MIIVFTGNGKGKTTAALGQAIRALGQDKKVLIVQFIKGPWISGEHKFFKKFKVQSLKLKAIVTGKGFVKILGDKLPFSEHKKAAEDALKLAKKEINPPTGGQKWDLIILDEINVAVNLKLIEAADVSKILKNKYPRKSASIDIILTGRNAPKSFIKIADLVTEMKEIKHPFSKGSPAKDGVEY
ncbi:MAG: Cob(I)yrinic acid a,c-diamide adenosyltransferase [Actinobacteria bacterium]|nr:Cob(I)yrinic acid a,c-diamide adenosyltransferase [Actinomycetota bacterium]